jgi:hypothetical protein
MIANGTEKRDANFDSLKFEIQFDQLYQKLSNLLQICQKSVHKVLNCRIHFKPTHKFGNSKLRNFQGSKIRLIVLLRIVEHYRTVSSHDCDKSSDRNLGRKLVSNRAFQTVPSSISKWAEADCHDRCDPRNSFHEILGCLKRFNGQIDHSVSHWLHFDIRGLETWISLISISFSIFCIRHSTSRWFILD